jgi:hypothetical protein
MYDNKYERCVLEVKQQQPPECKKQKWKGYTKEGKRCYNPWAVCAATIGRSKVSDKLKNLEKQAIQLGATEFGRSRAKNKKYYVVYKGKKIHFGDTRYEDYTTHGDSERRKRYLARAKKIKNKEGRYTYRDKNSPNFWSVNLLW